VNGIIPKKMASFFYIKVKKFRHPFYISYYLGQILAIFLTNLKNNENKLKTKRP